MEETNNNIKKNKEASYTIGDHLEIPTERRKEIMEDISSLYAEAQNIEQIELAIKETFDNGDYDEFDLFYSGFTMAYIISSSRIAEDSNIRAKFWDFLLGIRRGDENGFIDPFEKSFPVVLNQYISSGILGSAIQGLQKGASISDVELDEIEREMADRELEKQEISSKSVASFSPMEDKAVSDDSIRDYIKTEKKTESGSKNVVEPVVDRIVGPVKTKKRLRRRKKE